MIINIVTCYRGGLKLHEMLRYPPVSSGTMPNKCRSICSWNRGILLWCPPVPSSTRKITPERSGTPEKCKLQRSALAPFYIKFLSFSPPQCDPPVVAYVAEIS